MKPRGPEAARSYDDLASDYHLVCTDWDASVAQQSARLDGLVRAATA